MLKAHSQFVCYAAAGRANEKKQKLLRYVRFEYIYTNKKK